LLNQRRWYHEALLQLPLLTFPELGRCPQLPFRSSRRAEAPHHSLLRLNKMAAVQPPGPSALRSPAPLAGIGHPSLSGACLCPGYKGREYLQFFTTYFAEKEEI